MVCVVYNTFNMKNSLVKSSIVIISSFIFVVTIVSAWVAPSATPPNANTASPITVSSVNQVKLGGLGVGSLVVEGGALFKGNVQINGKATSASTVSSDGGTTLVTKDYITNRYRSGRTTVGFYNAQPHSWMSHVTFSPACTNPIITTQTTQDSLLCGNGSGPIACPSYSSDSEDIHSYAMNITPSGFDVFLSGMDGVWVGASSPAFQINWIATCD